MKNTIRSLERYLACQIAQVALKPSAEDYVERWKRAHEQREFFPPINEIAGAVEAARAPVLTNTPLHNYLDQCIDDDRIPDPDRIVMAIVHGYAQENLMNHDKTCRCPARKLLCHNPLRN